MVPLISYVRRESDASCHLCVADFRRFKQRGEGTPSPSGKRDHTEHEKHECNKRNSGREEEQEEAERLVPPVVFAIHASPLGNPLATVDAVARRQLALQLDDSGLRTVEYI